MTVPFEAFRILTVVDLYLLMEDDFSTCQKLNWDFAFFSFPLHLRLDVSFSSRLERPIWRENMQTFSDSTRNLLHEWKMLNCMALHASTLFEYIIHVCVAYLSTIPLFLFLGLLLFLGFALLFLLIWLSSSSSLLTSFLRRWGWWRKWRAHALCRWRRAIFLINVHRAK